LSAGRALDLSNLLLPTHRQMGLRLLIKGPALSRAMAK
jgi:hypothetical protein